MDCLESSGNFPWNTTCAFECEEGFELMGPKRVQCTSSGNWDNKEPTCKGRVWLHVKIYCRRSFSQPVLERVRPDLLMYVGVCVTAVTCAAIGHPQNGSVSCSHAPAGEFTFGSFCNFTCKEGFLLQGPGQLECTAQGKWSQQVPVCEGKPKVFSFLRPLP